jgi:hypothetical protein
LRRLSSLRLAFGSSPSGPFVISESSILICIFLFGAWVVIAAFFVGSIALIDWLSSSRPIPPKPRPNELSSSPFVFLNPIAALDV